MEWLVIAGAQGSDEGIYLPEGGASTVAWVIFAVVIAGLYWTVTRTRRRAEREFWERKRKERGQRDDGDR